MYGLSEKTYSKIKQVLEKYVKIFEDLKEKLERLEKLS